MKSFLQRHRLSAFFLLAFALSWYPWLLTLLRTNESVLAAMLRVYSFSRLALGLALALLTGNRRQLGAVTPQAAPA